MIRISNFTVRVGKTRVSPEAGEARCRTLLFIGQLKPDAFENIKVGHADNITVSGVGFVDPKVFARVSGQRVGNKRS